MVQILNGLLPNCVLRRGVVLQYWILYCRDLGFEGKDCIAIQSLCPRYSKGMGAEQALGVQVGAGRACVLSVQGARAAGRAGRWGAEAAGAGACRASGHCAPQRRGARGAAAGARTRHGRAGRAAGAFRGARGGRLGVPVRAAWACWLGQLGQVGALCTWLSSDSVFGPGSTWYFSRVTK